MRIIFATVSSSAQFSQVLTEHGGRNRLLSFYDLMGRNKPDEFMATFVMTGLNPKHKERVKRWDYRVPHYLKFRIMALLDRQAFYEANPREKDYEIIQD